MNYPGFRSGKVLSGSGRVGAVAVYVHLRDGDAKASKQSVKGNGEKSRGEGEAKEVGSLSEMDSNRAGTEHIEQYEAIDK